MKFLNKLFNDNRGSITIYMVIVFTAVLAVTGLLVDLGRIKIAQNQVRRIVDGAARSTLANYNSRLKNDYGLFGVNEQPDAENFEKYVKKNMSASNDLDFNLLEYNLENCSFYLSTPINSHPVLKQQILETMKYKAPIEFTKELIQRLRPLGKMGELFDYYNGQRKNNYKINEKIELIHKCNKNIEKARDDLRKNKLLWKKVKEQIEKENNGKKLESLKEKKARLEKTMASLRKNIQDEVKKAEQYRRSIDKELKNLDKKSNLSVYNHVSQSKTAKVEEDQIKGYFEKSKSQAVENLKNIDNDINKTRKALKEEARIETTNTALFKDIGIGAASIAYNNFENWWNNPVSTETQSLNPDSVNATISSEITSHIKKLPISRTPSKFERTSGPLMDSMVSFFKSIFSIINFDKKLVELRDEIYINEYILTYFSNLNSEPKGGYLYIHRFSEAEYICFGKNSIFEAVNTLYFTRLSLNTAAYLIYSKVNIHPLVKPVYSLVMGAVEAAADVFKLLVKKEEVPIASMSPNNPFDKPGLQVDYLDHLRLFLLMKQGEEQKLGKILELIEMRNKINPSGSYTLLNGEVETSIKMWFLPLAGLSMENGPFKTELRNGRCYIKKSVEFGY